MLRRPRMVSVRMDARVSLPIWVPSSPKPMTTLSPSMDMERTLPTSTPAMRTLSLLLRPPVSENWA